MFSEEQQEACSRASTPPHSPCAGCHDLRTMDSDGVNNACQIELENRLKRRANQWPLANYLVHVSGESLRLCQELDEEKQRCKSLGSSVSVTNVSVTARCTSKEIPQNFSRSSLLGVFSLPPQRPKPPTIGMNSPRGDRNTARVMGSRTTPIFNNLYSAPGLPTESPSVLYPLDSISESSPRTPEDSGLSWQYQLIGRASDIQAAQFLVF